jgi:SAM-dependent methyltransferase
VRSGSVDVAWLSTVWHQLSDPDAAALELRRVVRPGGHVLIRGFFADLPVSGLFAHFPGIDRSARTFPTTRQVTATLAAADLQCETVRDVIEPWRFELNAWVESVRRVRAIDSALRPLTDAEIEAGITSVVERFAGERKTVESDTVLRLLVFQ